MTSSRYPPKPEVEKNLNGRVDIAYNGVKLILCPKGNIKTVYAVGLSKLEETLRGKIRETAFTPYQGDDRFGKERDLSDPDSREKCLRWMRDYATWLTQDDIKTFDGLMQGLAGIVAEKPHYAQPIHGPPNQALKEKERKAFNDLWMRRFRDNT